MFCKALATKPRSIFPNDPALIKQVYLAVEEAAKKWTFRHRDWAMIYCQLIIYFGDRLGERAQMQKRDLHRISDTPVRKQVWSGGKMRKVLGIGSEAISASQRIEERKKKEPPLGAGERFATLSKKLEKKGATNPDALAAWIGRKDLGKKRFQKLAAKGRKKASK
ncbi:MAG: hypothetical protein NT006_04955 [Candidatus Aminicenantes bacterium]|nr:hypothetical protein [Candidatus Aminicenantes bacterium]